VLKIARVAGAGLVVHHAALEDGQSNIVRQGRARVSLDELPFAAPYRLKRHQGAWSFAAASSALWVFACGSGGSGGPSGDDAGSASSMQLYQCEPSGARMRGYHCGRQGRGRRHRTIDNLVGTASDVSALSALRASSVRNTFLPCLYPPAP
jgi:hypothetical protein